MDLPGRIILTYFVLGFTEFPASQTAAGKCCEKNAVDVDDDLLHL